MNEIFNNPDLSTFFDVLEKVKYGYDAGAKNILYHFRGVSLDGDSYYELENEILCNSAEFVNVESVYERNDDGSFNEDGEELYTKYFFSSTDMTEYYRELYRLYSKRLISCREYQMKRCEMTDFVKIWLLNTECYACGSMWCSLMTKINHKYASAIRINIDYNNCCCYVTDLSVALITIFAKYTKELKLLREKYGNAEAER